MQPTVSSPAGIINKPKAVSKRIEVIDALRGFALLGIILTHSSVLYENSLFGSVNLGTLNNAVMGAIDALFRGRAFLIFCFLFGLSFAIQIQSAKSKNKPFTGRFIWRLAILLAIGYIHRLIYAGDILQTYAMLGLALLVCANLKNKGLLLVSMLLFIASIVVRFYKPEMSGVLTPLANSAR